LIEVATGSSETKVRGFIQDESILGIGNCLLMSIKQAVQDNDGYRDLETPTGDFPKPTAPQCLFLAHDEFALV
jgi:hypothetical protein